MFRFDFDKVNRDLLQLNKVRGPYSKLRTGKKRASVIYSTGRENEVSNLFVISLRLIGRAEKGTS